MNSYTYLVVIKDFEPINDWTFLANLYGPIIGQEAVGLYLTLINESQVLKQLNYPKFDQSRLHRITGMHEEALLLTLKKLGSLKLIKTKINRKTNFKKFEVFNPLEPSEFFANNLFERILAQKIGQENLEALKFIFKEKVDLEADKDYEDITANFEDIFSNELSVASDEPITNPLFFKLQSSKKTLLEKMFDLNQLNEILKKASIKINYNLNKTKKLFNWALSLFNFDETTFAQLIIGNYDYKKNYLDFKKFETAVRDYAWSQKSKIEPSYLLKPLISLESNSPSVTWDQIKIYETMANDNFIYELIGDFPKNREQDLLDDLKNKLGLKRGAINLCLAYCYLVNRRIVPNYMYKLAESLQRDQLMQTEEVFVHFVKILNKKQRKQNHQNQTLTNFDFSNPLHQRFDNDKIQSKI